MEEFKYLGTTLINKNSIQEEIKSRLKSGNACYYSVQNLLSSRLLSKKLKIKIYRTIILPVVLYGPCNKWVPVFKAWRVLRFRMEERPPIWRVAANILNKQSRTADKGWSSSLGVGRGADNTSP